MTTSARALTSATTPWYIDGIPITDMAALGASPTCYDFDMFQEPLDIGAEKASRSAIVASSSTWTCSTWFNSASVLGRQHDVQATGDTGFNRVLVIMNPRIVRLGVRVQF